jgi:hypothetical protein
MSIPSVRIAYALRCREVYDVVPHSVVYPDKMERMAVEIQSGNANCGRSKAVLVRIRPAIVCGKR